MQNKLIRFVLDLHHRSSIHNIHFKTLNWLPVSKRVEEITLLHVFKVRKGLAPKYMMEQFVEAVSTHSHDARFSRSGCFAVPRVGTHERKSFTYVGCNLWNRLSNNIKSISCLSPFKVNLKKKNT